MARGAATHPAIEHRRPADLRDGVSVIVPSHHGREHIGPCLRSLAAQSLARNLFEIIVVLNGEPDGTRGLLDDFQRDNPDLHLRVHEIAEASASRARNAGIAAASRLHTTFVDDDDSVSPAYLKTLLAHAGPGVVPFAQIVDVDGTGHVDPFTTINTQTIRYTGRAVHPVHVPRAVGFNACKLVPTQLARQVRYDPDLHSGDDIVFFMTLLAHHDFEIQVCPVDSGPDAENAVYYRLLRPNSISRQAVSFDFNVTARMEVISRLDALTAICADERRRKVIRLTMDAQASFINRYLQANPEELDRVLRTIEAYGVTDFPFPRITGGLARSLVVSYCLPPYSDTSGIVAAKRVRERGEIVDVVYNAMDSVRDVDPNTTRITQGMIDRNIRLATPTLFAHWPAVEQFCAQGLDRLENHKDAKPGYERLYSRVTWPASHFLAAAYKARHPTVRWSAEFSDPVSHGIDGRERTIPIMDGPLLDEFRAYLRRAGLPVPTTTNAFRWCEYLAYAMADELIFTNENQMEYMLGYCEHPELSRAARGRALVRPQPTLPDPFYAMVDSAYEMSQDEVNLAYFGAFYATRGIDDVLVAIDGLHRDVRDRLRLHVFTGDGDALRSRVTELGLARSVVIRPYVGYLEFLNLTTRFDWLIVNDATTAGTHPCNPYLPSKWSDYRGSGTPVWALVEAGSPLSGQPVDHLSPAGDADAARAFLEAVVTSRFGADPRAARRSTSRWPLPRQRRDRAQPPAQPASRP